MPLARRSLLRVAAATIGIALGACAAGEDPTTTGVGGARATATSSTGGGSFVSSGGGSTGFGGGCAGKSFKAVPVPLDIFVMLDQSGSMNLDAGNSTTRWQSVKAALTSFVQQPNTDGIGIGIQYFGLPEPSVPGCYVIECATDADCTGGCGGCNASGVCTSPYNPDIDSCDPLDYAWAEVPIQPLPGAANLIIGSMAMHQPGTNTPTSPALGGAIHYAKAWAEKNPSHIVVVAFATDGEPSECDVDIDNLNQIAEGGFAGTPSIKTFVIGVGGAFQLLDGIAAAGGTGAAYLVDLDVTATEQFLDAMNTIRGSALGCTYQIPAPPAGMTEDFTRVNVAYQPGDQGPEQTFPKVLDKAHCPASGDGWYYDSEASPTVILLCDATCDKVSGDLMGEIDVVLGCTSILE